MKAQFEITDALAMALDSDPDNEQVVLTIRRRYHTVDAPDPDECCQWRDDTINLRKSQARAIASAMMGCAAEL